MGYKYNGPPMEHLPESIRDRITEVARIAEEETEALGVVLNGDTELPHPIPDQLWRRFDGFNEVFVYDFGTLHEAHFKTGDRVFRLSFYGVSLSKDNVKIERALGLQVTQRPQHNQDAAQIMIEGQPLEKIVGMGHSPFETDHLKYECKLSGPYMGRN